MLLLFSRLCSLQVLQAWHFPFIISQNVSSLSTCQPSIIITRGQRRAFENQTSNHWETTTFLHDQHQKLHYCSAVLHRSKSWCCYWMLLRLLGEKSTRICLESSQLGHESEAEFFQGLPTYLARDRERSSRKEKI